MSSQMESIQRTQRTQCYFCGEEMPASQLEIHVKHCGCVLEKCLEGCGLYVQRQYKNHHKNWCKKDPTQEPQWQDMSGELARLRKHVEQEAAQRALQQQELLQQVDTVNQKMAKTEELNLKLIDAVTGIRKLVNDEQCARLNDILEVKTNVSESAKVITQLKFTLNQARVDVEELRNEIQSNEQYEKMYDQFSEWKKKQDEIVTGIKITMSKDIQAEINKLHKDNVMRSKSVNDLLDLNEVIIDNQDSYTEQIFQLEEDVKGFKKFLAEENIMISGIWREQLDEVKHLKSKFEETGKAMSTLFDEQNKIKDRLERVESFSKDLNNSNTNNGKIKILERTMSEDLIKELLDDRKLFKEKLESLELQNKPEAERTFSTDTSLSVFDETIVKQQEEIAKRLEMLEKLTTEIQNNCNKRSSTSTNNEQSETPVVINELSSEQAVIKRRLEMLEMITHELEEAKTNKKLLPTDSTVSINGRLMWTISNFDQKLDECKKTRTQIESPSFYTSENGYKLQLRAYLNGVGQWEGRHMIVSLNVLESQWDNRLVWPCRLKVVICLRDQEPIHRKAKDIVKSFTSSPASKGFSAPCLQMFIPHRTLYTRNYLKNNVVIIEVKTLPL